MIPVEPHRVAHSTERDRPPVRSEAAATRLEPRSAPTSQRPSVCFVALKAYAALSDREDLAHVGGAERQQILLGEELVQRGYRVSFVVLDHGQPDGEVIRGFRVFKCYGADRGIRGARFFHPRLTRLWHAMGRADADVYYQRGAASETGLAANWCHRHSRGFIFAVAHDTDCMRVPSIIVPRSERALFRYGLRRAHAVITQTLRQQRVLLETYGLTSTVIRSCPPWSTESQEPSGSCNHEKIADRVLWVGRLSEEKRPEWVVQLATDLPESRFDVVGQSNVDAKYGRILAERAGSLPNLRWHGYVTHSKMKALYQQARLLLCTSESEGFPNVFLEAWTCGKAVLTSVDPDGVVATFQIGQVTTSYPAMRHALATLANQHEWWEAAGHRGRDYVREHHSTPAAADALGAVIEMCYESVRARRARAAGSAVPPDLRKP